MQSCPFSIFPEKTRGYYVGTKSPAKCLSLSYDHCIKKAILASVTNCISNFEVNPFKNHNQFNILYFNLVFINVSLESYLSDVLIGCYNDLIQCRRGDSEALFEGYRHHGTLAIEI